MHVFGRCLNHDEPKSNAWAHHNCLNLVCYEWTQVQRPVIELYFLWKPKIVSWVILSPSLEPIKGVYTWSTSKAKSSQDACLPRTSPSHFIIIKVQAFQKIIIKVQAISSKYWKIITKAQAFQVQTQAISSKYQKIIIKVQAHQVLSILNGPRRSKQPNFASLHIWFATS